MVIIRTVQISDLDQLLILLPQLSSRPTSPRAQVPLREAAATILAQICADERTKLLVAEQPGQNNLVGTLTLVIIPNLTHGGRPWAMIENVVVTQARRREGIGQQLMHEAIRLAQLAGCYKVQLISGTKAEQAAFYRQVGFQSEVCVGFRLYTSDSVVDNVEMSQAGEEGGSHLDD